MMGHFAPIPSIWGCQLGKRVHSSKNFFSPYFPGKIGFPKKPGLFGIWRHFSSPNICEGLISSNAARASAL